VIETIIEPTEDTTAMVCIGREVTDELDYTPAELHINRIIRLKYITREDEQGKQGRQEREDFRRRDFRNGR